MSTATKPFVLGVDLDGVCADFHKGIRPIAAERLGRSIDDLAVEVSYGLAEWGLKADDYRSLHRFAVTQRKLFETLEPVDGAPAARGQVSNRG